MPTYQYRCKQCGHTMEEFQSITEPPLVRCPNCHTDNLVRILGSGAGVIFKGSGFYLTDYKNKRSDQSRKSADTEGEKKKDPAKTSKPDAPPKEKKE